MIDATIVITTKDRREDLARAVESALAQEGDVEVLVIDDGSTDGTAEMVRRDFPRARLESSDASRGYIVQRNRGAELARGRVIFSIDDDAAFSSPRVVAQALALFDHDRIGAVAIPFVNVNEGSHIYQQAPDAGGTWVADTFIGTAHALRRDLFLALGGYRDYLVHQGEEMDYALRMLDRGYVVRLGHGDPIHHFESPRRSYTRMDRYGRRNDILFAWHNVPMPVMAVHVAANTVSGWRLAARVRRPRNNIIGTWWGVRDAARSPVGRHPVRRGTYSLYRRLKRRGPLPLGPVLESVLPPLPVEAPTA